MSEPRFY